MQTYRIFSNIGKIQIAGNEKAGLGDDFFKNNSIRCSLQTLREYSINLISSCGEKMSQVHWQIFINLEFHAKV